MTYGPVDTKSGTTYQVSTSTRTIQVDFADRSSVERLKTLTPQFRGFKRFSKDYFADFGNTVLFHLDIDIPEPPTASSDNLRRWLVGLVNERLVELAVRHEAIAEEAPDPQAIDHWKYQGDIRDTEALGQFASRKSFAIHRKEYGEDNRDYPPHFVQRPQPPVGEFERQILLLSAKVVQVRAMELASMAERRQPYPIHPHTHQRSAWLLYRGNRKLRTAGECSDRLALAVQARQR